MRRFTQSCLVGVAVLLATPLRAQSAAHVGAELGLGLAHRTSTALLLPTDGIQASVHATFPIHKNLQLVGAGSWSRFADQELTTPFYCPDTANCAAPRVPGLGMAGLAAGIQPMVPLGPLQLRLNGLAGGYWLYHHPRNVAGLAAGLEGGATLALPIGTKVHFLVQGSMVHLLGEAGAAANSRHMGVGVAFE